MAEHSFVTRTQAAMMLGVCPETVTRMSEDGRLGRPVMIGGASLRWLRAEVERLASRAGPAAATEAPQAKPRRQGDSEGMRRALSVLPEHREGVPLGDDD